MAGITGHLHVASGSSAPLCVNMPTDVHIERGGPDLFLIRSLHRHPDGYVAFAVERDDEFRPTFAIKASELETLFPEFVEQLQKDSFVSINSSWRLGLRSRNRLATGPPSHSTETLRYLCACYADLDFYKLDIEPADFGGIMAAIIAFQDRGLVPPASVIVRSGRGAWLLWFLRDRKNEAVAQPAFYEKRDLYFRIQASIVERLSALGCDPSAKDAARYMRVPGSLHTRSERQVEWWLQGQQGKVYSYTLEDLALAFDVSLDPPKRIVSKAFENGELKQPNKRKGWEALNHRRLRDFQALRGMRQRFYEGNRNHAALIYAWLLRRTGLPRSVVEMEVEHLASECSPRLTSRESRGAVNSAFKRGKGALTRFREQTISDWLDVKPNEAEFLEGFPPASRFGLRRLKPSPTPPDGKPAAHRRQLLQEIIGTLGYIPSYRTLAAKLSDAGHPISHVQVLSDCRQMGLESERSKRARERRRTHQALLPMLEGTILVNPN